VSFDWVWLMPNKASAKRAIKVGVFRLWLTGASQLHTCSTA
jgi:hypothetical protein